MAGRRAVTIRDIAGHADVSAATVSAALRSRGDDDSGVAPETRERVLRAAEELGYDFARLRAQPQRQTTVAVFCSGYNHPNNSTLYPLLMELSERLAHNGLRLLLESGHGAYADPVAAGELFRRGEADAAICVVTGDRWADRMGDWGVPAVYVGSMDSEAEICRVAVDDHLGGRLVGEHLWALGHRGVGIIHMHHTQWGQRRAEGMRSVWRGLGEDIPDACIQTLTDLTEEEIAAAVRALLAGRAPKSRRVTALFCDADWVAAQVIREVRQLGLGVPRDVSVVGFDDSHFATALDPALTTVRQPFPEMSALAVQLLLEQLSLGGQMRTSYTLPCELVVRGTTGRAGR